MPAKREKIASTWILSACTEDSFHTHEETCKIYIERKAIILWHPRIHCYKPKCFWMIKDHQSGAFMVMLTTDEAYVVLFGRRAFII